MRTTILVFIGIIIVFFACKQIPPIEPSGSLGHIPYQPTPYTVEKPTGFPAMVHPADNPITVEGIELGRHLFYDPILSRDSTISCSSCHQQEKAFTDGRTIAVGIDGRVGKRNSMSLINVGYNFQANRPYNFMWDGRFQTLEQQVLEGAILDPLEMDNTWEKAETDLRKHPAYPEMFRKAFGIEYKSAISRDLVAKAIAQFERTLNSANSAYDSIITTPFAYLTNEQDTGFQLFLGDAQDGIPNILDAECAHCHSFSPSKMLFARNDFSNNGLNAAPTFNDFPDKGYGAITGNQHENGLFREVSLRNIALTAPYMHDGRFQTLEEVIDQYVSGIKHAPNLATELESGQELPQLTDRDKSNLIAFLHTLTDSSYFHKPEWSSPF